MKIHTLFLLIVALGRCMAQQPHVGKTAPAAPTPQADQSQAHDSVMKFLLGVRISPLPEGRQLLGETQWIVGPPDFGEDFYARPDYVEVGTLYAGLFDTDIPAVKGYKELLDMKAVTKAGTIRDLKYLAVCFRDAYSGNWKILVAHDNVGADGTFDESALDVDRRIDYFGDRLTHALHNSVREKIDDYRQYGEWLLVGGHIREAQAALQEAREQRANGPSVGTEPAAASGESPLQRVARIAAQARATIAVPSEETPLERANRTTAETLEVFKNISKDVDAIRDSQIDSLLNAIEHIAPQVGDVK